MKNRQNEDYEDDGTGLGRVFSVFREGENFVWVEGCDNYYDKTLTKAESIELIKELFAFIVGEQSCNGCKYHLRCSGPKMLVVPCDGFEKKIT